MEINAVDKITALEIIASLSGDEGPAAIKIAKLALGVAAENEARYAALYFEDKCKYCGKRPHPHPPYDYFIGYKNGPPNLLGHFCDKGGRCHKYMYHTFDTVEDWREWNSHHDS
jgi:hypothetical protein